MAPIFKKQSDYKNSAFRATEAIPCTRTESRMWFIYQSFPLFA